MTKLHDLYDRHGQSPWLDNLRRGWLTSGELRRYVEQGVKGITSNPTIFQKAMAGDEYDDQFEDLVRGGTSVEDTYWRLVTDDIEAALAILAPVHRDTGGEDGYVSVEVDPGLARDTAGTLESARLLHERIDEPNLYVKIPGTEEGLPAIEQMIAERRSVNVTLIFGLDRYREVMEAYLSGLERADGTLVGVSSVASFFISRVDTEVDRRLDEIGTERALALRGRTGVAQGQVAYRMFTETFAGDRWDALAARGAWVQRPLWASTSTKNDAYPETLYIDSLIGPHTVNTMPDDTIEAFERSGTVARTVDADPDAAQQVLDDVADVGVDLDDVSARLEDEGVASFSKSFDGLMQTLREKAGR